MTIASVALAAVDYAGRPWVASGQIFVSVVPVSGASQGSVSSFESDSRQAAIDLSQVAAGRLFATLVRHATGSSSSPASIQSGISASANNRVLTVADSTSSSAMSLANARTALRLLTGSARGRLVGGFEARRTLLTVISPASISRQPASHILLVMAARILLGAVIALIIALLWDYLTAPAAVRRS